MLRWEAKLRAEDRKTKIKLLIIYGGKRFLSVFTLLGRISSAPRLDLSNWLMIYLYCIELRSCPDTCEELRILDKGSSRNM